ncbi:hypothetical protein PUN28_014638 [Cardiocondyla obscurior]|uniref:Uncharacterized protein n=1 Tax=Cardiocondyla obscurior TaxID=286306 RepID=A0AAW2F674_9HYME
MNERPNKKVRRGKRTKRVITPAFLPTSPESDKENLPIQPKILSIKNFTGRIKILPRKKLDEGIQLLPWRLIPIEESPPRTLLKIEEKDQHKDIGTQAEISSPLKLELRQRHQLPRLEPKQKSSDDIKQRRRKKKRATH